MKGSGEPAFASDKVRPAFEDLRGQPGWHGFRLPGEGTAHTKPAGRVAASHDLDRADRLRPSRLCGVERILCGRGAGLDLRHIEVAGEALLFALVGEFRILLVDIERLLRVGFLLRGLDGSEVRARYGSGEGLPGKL